MVQIPEAFNFMLAAWNETDIKQIRVHLDKSLAENVVFVDPSNFVEGKDAFEQMIVRFRSSYPDGRCVRTSGIDSHHNRYRYSWSVFAGEKLLVPGIDFVQLNADGLVERVDGFFGPLPPLETATL